MDEARKIKFKFSQGPFPLSLSPSPPLPHPTAGCNNGGTPTAALYHNMHRVPVATVRFVSPVSFNPAQRVSDTGSCCWWWLWWCWCGGVVVPVAKLCLTARRTLHMKLDEAMLSETVWETNLCFNFTAIEGLHRHKSIGLSHVSLYLRQFQLLGSLLTKPLSAGFISPKSVNQ